MPFHTLKSSAHYRTHFSITMTFVNFQYKIRILKYRLNYGKIKMESTKLLHKIKYLLEHADDIEDLENIKVDYLLSANPSDEKSMLAVEMPAGKFMITVEEI